MTIWTFLGGGLSPILKLASHHVPKPAPQPIRLPKALPAPPETGGAEIDRIVRALDAKKDDWVRLPARERAKLVKSCVGLFVDKWRHIAEVSTDMKGSWGQGIGEEGFVVLACVLSLQDYYRSLCANGQPRAMQMSQHKCGASSTQTRAQVLPNGAMGILFPTFRGEVWIEPGQPASQGQVYRKKEQGMLGHGGVALVLGAGNQLSVVVLDVLHKLLAEDQVVIVKMNPVNAAIGPLLRFAMAPFVEQGYLEFVYGAKEAAERLVHHPQVSSIHLTGSADTYNSIMWGAPDAPRTGKPRVSKPITAELGCVTPHIIVPGEWSVEEMEHQACNVVSGIVHNAGHNCLKTEVIVTSRDWPQRGQFLAAVRQRLDATQQRRPWYPGSDARHQAFKSRFPQAESLGSPGPAASSAHVTLPWLLATGLTPEEANLSTENWCGVVQEVPLGGASVPAFLNAASSFVNDRVAGSLSCTVTIDPRTQQGYPSAFDEFVQRLRYGSISVNVMAAAAFGFGSLGWGAFPGNTPTNIGSGMGMVHNACLYDHIQKSVLYGTWLLHPKPFWWPDNRNVEGTLPYVFQFARHIHNPLAALWHATLTAIAAVQG